MKLYSSVGPNPRVVRMFMAEKGIDIAKEEVDIRAGLNRQADYLKVNPTGTCPALELDDGRVLSEVTAICEYLDEKHPAPPLIGTTAEERAETRMWARRIDLGICEPMANGFRFGEGLKMFQNRIRCLPEASDGLKAIAQDRIAQMAGKQYVCGDRITMADVMLFCFLDFGNAVGQKIDPANANVAAWYERMKARPSAAA
jgi:glutathione S-transferase